MSEVFGTIFALGIVLQLVLEWLRESFDPDAKAPRWMWITLAVVGGEALAIAFGANILAGMSTTRAQTWAGQILTGVALAAGSGLLHKLKAALEGVRRR